MTKRFPEQAERFATMPVLSSDAVTDRWLWNLSMLMREIAQNPAEVAIVRESAKTGIDK